MDLHRADKTALVLGAGGGPGAAIAMALAAEDAQVAVVDIDAEAAHRTAADIECRGGRACSLQWDLARIDAIDDKVDEVERRLGPVDTHPRAQ